jgi:hypothetical protein
LTKSIYNGLSGKLTSSENFIQKKTSIEKENILKMLKHEKSLAEKSSSDEMENYYLETRD